MFWWYIVFGKATLNENDDDDKIVVVIGLIRQVPPWVVSRNLKEEMLLNGLNSVFDRWDPVNLSFNDAPI